MTIVLGDGDRLVGSRLNRSLWYLERDEIVACDICGRPHVHREPKADYRSAEVASEPVTPEDSWKAVPNGVVFAVGLDFRLHFEPLRVPSAAIASVD